MRWIILSEASRVVIGPLGRWLPFRCSSQMSLASIVTVRELMFQGEILAAATHPSVPIFILCRSCSTWGP